MRARKSRRLVAGSVAFALGAGCLTAAPVAAQPDGGHAGGHAAVQAIVDSFTARRVPGAMVFAQDRHRRWTVSSGTGELDSDRPIRPWHRMRVASNTKMFVAAVVLQLVGAGQGGVGRAGRAVPAGAGAGQRV